MIVPLDCPLCGAPIYCERDSAVRDVGATDWRAAPVAYCMRCEFAAEIEPRPTNHDKDGPHD